MLTCWPEGKADATRQRRRRCVAAPSHRHRQFRHHFFSQLFYTSMTILILTLGTWECHQSPSNITTTTEEKVSKIMSPKSLSPSTFKSQTLHDARERRISTLLSDFFLSLVRLCSNKSHNNNDNDKHARFQLFAHAFRTDLCFTAQQASTFNPQREEILSADNCVDALPVKIDLTTNVQRGAAEETVSPIGGVFIQIFGSSFASLSSLVVVSFIDPSLAAVSGPLSLTVKNTTFEFDAYMFVENYLSPRSTISISNNTFRGVSIGWHMGFLAGSIVISSPSLKINSNTTIDIINNTLQRIDIDSAVLLHDKVDQCLICLLLGSDANQLHEINGTTSWVRIDGNRVLEGNALSAFAAAPRRIAAVYIIETAPTSLSITNGGSLFICRNTVGSLDPFYVVPPKAVFDASAVFINVSALILSYSGQLLLHDNALHAVQVEESSSTFLPPADAKRTDWANAVTLLVSDRFYIMNYAKVEVLRCVVSGVAMLGTKSSLTASGFQLITANSFSQYSSSTLVIKECASQSHQFVTAAFGVSFMLKHFSTSLSSTSVTHNFCSDMMDASYRCVGVLLLMQTLQQFRGSVHIVENRVERFVIKAVVATKPLVGDALKRDAAAVYWDISYNALFNGRPVPTLLNISSNRVVDSIAEKIFAVFLNVGGTGLNAQLNAANIGSFTMLQRVSVAIERNTVAIPWSVNGGVFAVAVFVNSSLELLLTGSTLTVSDNHLEGGAFLAYPCTVVVTVPRLNMSTLATALIEGNTIRGVNSHYVRVVVVGILITRVEANSILSLNSNTLFNTTQGEIEQIPLITGSWNPLQDNQAAAVFFAMTLPDNYEVNYPQSDFILNQTRNLPSIIVSQSSVVNINNNTVHGARRMAGHVTAVMISRRIALGKVSNGMSNVFEIHSSSQLNINGNRVANVTGQVYKVVRTAVRVDASANIAVVTVDAFKVNITGDSHFRMHENTFGNFANVSSVSIVSMKVRSSLTLAQQSEMSVMRNGCGTTAAAFGGFALVTHLSSSSSASSGTWLCLPLFNTRNSSHAVYYSSISTKVAENSTFQIDSNSLAVDDWNTTAVMGADEGSFYVQSALASSVHVADMLGSRPTPADPVSYAFVVVHAQSRTWLVESGGALHVGSNVAFLRSVSVPLAAVAALVLRPDADDAAANGRELLSSLLPRVQRYFDSWEMDILSSVSVESVRIEGVQMTFINAEITVSSNTIELRMTSTREGEESSPMPSSSAALLPEPSRLSLFAAQFFSTDFFVATFTTINVFSCAVHFDSNAYSTGESHLLLQRAEACFFGVDVELFLNAAQLLISKCEVSSNGLRSDNSSPSPRRLLVCPPQKSTPCYGAPSALSIAVAAASMVIKGGVFADNDGSDDDSIVPSTFGMTRNRVSGLRVGGWRGMSINQTVAIKISGAIFRLFGALTLMKNHLGEKEVIYLAENEISSLGVEAFEVRSQDNADCNAVECQRAAYYSSVFLDHKVSVEVMVAALQLVHTERPSSETGTIIALGVGTRFVFKMNTLRDVSIAALHSYFATTSSMGTPSNSEVMGNTIACSAQQFNAPNKYPDASSEEGSCSLRPLVVGVASFWVASSWSTTFGHRSGPVVIENTVKRVNITRWMQPLLASKATTADFATRAKEELLPSIMSFVEILCTDGLILSASENVFEISRNEFSDTRIDTRLADRYLLFFHGNPSNPFTATPLSTSSVFEDHLILVFFGHELRMLQSSLQIRDNAVRSHSNRNYCVSVGGAEPTSNRLHSPHAAHRCETAAHIIRLAFGSQISLIYKASIHITNNTATDVVVGWALPHLPAFGDALCRLALTSQSSPFTVKEEADEEESSGVGALSDTSSFVMISSHAFIGNKSAGALDVGRLDFSMSRDSGLFIQNNRMFRVLLTVYHQSLQRAVQLACPKANLSSFVASLVGDDSSAPSLNATVAATLVRLFYRRSAIRLNLIWIQLENKHISTQSSFQLSCKTSAVIAIEGNSVSSFTFRNAELSQSVGSMWSSEEDSKTLLLKYLKEYERLLHQIVFVSLITLTMESMNASNTHAALEQDGVLSIRWNSLVFFPPSASANAAGGDVDDGGYWSEEIGSKDQISDSRATVSSAARVTAACVRRVVGGASSAPCGSLQVGAQKLEETLQAAFGGNGGGGGDASVLGFASEEDEEEERLADGLRTQRSNVSIVPTGTLVVLNLRGLDILDRCALIIAENVFAGTATPSCLQEPLIPTTTNIFTARKSYVFARTFIISIFSSSIRMQSLESSFMVVNNTVVAGSPIACAAVREYDADSTSFQPILLPVSVIHNASVRMNSSSLAPAEARDGGTGHQCRLLVIASIQNSLPLLLWQKGKIAGVESNTVALHAFMEAQLINSATVSDRSSDGGGGRGSAQYKPHEAQGTLFAIGHNEVRMLILNTAGDDFSRRLLGLLASSADDGESCGSGDNVGFDASSVTLTGRPESIIVMFASTVKPPQVDLFVFMQNTFTIDHPAQFHEGKLSSVFHRVNARSLLLATYGVLHMVGNTMELRLPSSVGSRRCGLCAANNSDQIITSIREFLHFVDLVVAPSVQIRVEHNALRVKFQNDDAMPSPSSLQRLNLTNRCYAFDALLRAWRPNIQHLLSSGASFRIENDTAAINRNISTWPAEVSHCHNTIFGRRLTSTMSSESVLAPPSLAVLGVFCGDTLTPSIAGDTLFSSTITVDDDQTTNTDEAECRGEVCSAFFVVQKLAAGANPSTWSDVELCAFQVASLSANDAPPQHGFVAETSGAFVPFTMLTESKPAAEFKDMVEENHRIIASESQNITTPTPVTAAFVLATLRVAFDRYAFAKLHLENFSANIPPATANNETLVSVVGGNHTREDTPSTYVFVFTLNITRRPPPSLLQIQGGEDTKEKENVLVHYLHVIATTLCDSSSSSSSTVAGPSLSRLIAIEVPIPARPLVPIPAEPFVPSPVTESIGVAAGVVVISLGGVALPVAGMQQGVSMALLRMMQCENDALDGEEPLAVLVHPLQFAVGEGDGRYARGAIIGNLILIPSVWAGLAYVIVPLLIHAVTHLSGGASASSSLALSRDFAGWPGSMIVPVAVLAEGTAMACVGLLSYNERSAGDAVLACLGVIILAAVTCAWCLVLFRLLAARALLLPSAHRLVCRRTEPAPLPRMLFHPRHEWMLLPCETGSLLVGEGGEGGGGVLRQSTLTEDEDDALAVVGGTVDPLAHNAGADVAQIINSEDTEEEMSPAALSCLRQRLFLVGDSWWLWSSFLAHCFSLLVGIAEGMPSNTEWLCRLRWAVAAVGAVGQSLVVLTNTIPLEIGLLGATSALSCLLVLFVALSTFGAYEGSSTVNDGVNVVGALNSFAGIALMSVGIICSATELVREYGRARAKRPVAHNPTPTPDLFDLVDESVSAPLLSPLSPLPQPSSSVVNAPRSSPSLVLSDDAGDVELLDMPEPTRRPPPPTQQHKPSDEVSAITSSNTVAAAANGRPKSIAKQAPLSTSSSPSAAMPTHWSALLSEIDDTVDALEAAKRAKK